MPGGPSRPHGVPAARSADAFYDQRGNTGKYKECHDTADCIFYMTNSAGTESRIYQGGVFRSEDLAFLAQKEISLVVNCTGHIDSPAWYGQPGTPRWIRFTVSGSIPRPNPEDPLKSWPVLANFWRLYQVIREALQTGSVYIHCRAGAHRAGTVTSAFAMMCTGCTAAEAVHTVRMRRRVTQVDGDNMFLLKMLETQLADWTRTGSVA